MKFSLGTFLVSPRRVLPNLARALLLYAVPSPVCAGFGLPVPPYKSIGLQLVKSIKSQAETMFPKGRENLMPKKANAVKGEPQKQRS